MGQNIYFHNITKNWFNCNDLGDAAESSEHGDLIKFSVRGNAQMFDLATLTPSDAEDYSHYRQDFIDCFKTFNDGADFFENDDLIKQESKLKKYLKKAYEDAKKSYKRSSKVQDRRYYFGRIQVARSALDLID
jgi:hypothetical protein